MRDDADAELELARKGFGRHYALRDRCDFEMALQMRLRVSEMRKMRVGQVYQYGHVVEAIPIDRDPMTGGKVGNAMEVYT